MVNHYHQVRVALDLVLREVQVQNKMRQLVKPLKQQWLTVLLQKRQWQQQQQLQVLTDLFLEEDLILVQEGGREVLEDQVILVQEVLKDLLVVIFSEKLAMKGYLVDPMVQVAQVIYLVAVQAAQVVQALTTQSMGQGCLLHWRLSSRLGHFLPPWPMFTSMERKRFWLPVLQLLVHAPQSPH